MSDAGRIGTIRSDGGCQFLGPFRAWCEEWGIHHELSSSYNPESNGLAETGVKILKLLMNKCLESGQEFQKCLYEYNCQMRSDGSCPANIYLGWRPKSAVHIIDDRGAIRLRNGKLLRPINKSRMVRSVSVPRGLSQEPVVPQPYFTESRVERTWAEVVRGASQSLVGEDNTVSQSQ